MISQTFLSELRVRVPVSEVARRRVQLRRVGREWRGLSPFNKERSPSFFVNDRKKVFHDFSSGKHGDVFTFVMETEGLDFRQAVDRVASIAGMALEETSSRPPRPRPAPPPPPPPPRREPDVEERQEKANRLWLARQLWSRSQPAEWTIVEDHLQARGYHGRIPATIRYLPKNGSHAPALIAAFGMAAENIRESSTGELVIADEDVMGVHLIKLQTDGRDRLRGEGAKITIGKAVTAPIVLAPPNDLLALDIAEGVEDALNAHQASGRGAWAAGGAGRLPGLADHVPSYIESVTIAVDANEAGRAGASGLADRLHARGIEVFLTPVGGGPA